MNIIAPFTSHTLSTKDEHGARAYKFSSIIYRQS